MPAASNARPRKLAQAAIKRASCIGGCGRTIEYRYSPNKACPECRAQRTRDAARRWQGKHPYIPKGRPAKVMQAAAKLIACAGGCGAMVEYRTNPKVCCAECSSARRAERARTGMERQRRKRGVPLIKGTTISCAICKNPFLRNRSADAKYCPTCAPEHYAKKARQFAQAKRATPEGKAYANAWQRNKKATDPRYAINGRMHTLMHKCLRGRKNGRKWATLVPYTIEQLMRHLERQFEPGMTWENRGAWHIDHRQPISSFRFASAEDAEFRACWALTNLQPLWAGANLTKNAKRLVLL